MSESAPAFNYVHSTFMYIKIVLTEIPLSLYVSYNFPFANLALSFALYIAVPF